MVQAFFDRKTGQEPAGFNVRPEPLADRGTAGALDRVAQIADCLPQARPFRLGFPRKMPVFPSCPPAAL
jgi:hypothetical protein